MHTKKLSFACKKKISENVCLRTKFDLRLEKYKKKFWGKFSKLLEKKLCRHQKMPVIQFPYMEIVRKAFFSKKNILNQFFFVTSLFNCSQKAAEVV